MRAYKIFEKFEEDSDPISDMGIGAQYWREKLKNHVVHHVLTSITTMSIHKLEKGFKESLTDIYFLTDDDMRKSDIFYEIKELLQKSKLIYEEKYINVYGPNNKDEKVIFKLYNTKYGKIGSFFYPDYSDLTTQYMGELTAAIHFFGKQYK